MEYVKDRSDLFIRTGYAYVPVQRMDKVYSPNVALKTGTIFPELNITIDEYERLKAIEEYIKIFVRDNYVRDFDYNKEAEIVNNEKSIKTKLQDSLVVLPKVNASTELILLVKARLKKIREDEIENY